ncbi:MAG TPA: hypothetical protein VFZ34_03945 [Blastocatellia bacterium]|nr:hypothetical protein [Blastocatellia bacterium]
MNHIRRSSLFLLLFFCLTCVTQAQQTSVNAADYSVNLAPGALASAFGVDLAATTEAARDLPLPTQLAGTRVLVNGKAASLLYVSPSQINYQIPADTPVGNVEVIVERATSRSRETINVRSAGFAAFSFDSTGTGAGAILDGRTFKAGPHEMQTDRGEATILALFGTGLGEASSKDFVSKRVRVFVGGIEAKVHYAGPQGQFVGLEQINFELPSGVANHGTLPVMVKVDDQPTNSVTVDVTTTETASLSVAVEESFTSSTEIAALRVSPFADIDTLKVTLRTVNLLTDQGVEVAVLSAPLTVDLLAPEAIAKLVKRLNIKAGTYVGLTAEISDVMAMYKGQPVAMKLANKSVKQSLRTPLKLDKETTVGVSFAFDVRASVKKDTSGYSFDPIMLLNVLAPTAPPQPLQKFEGKIAKLDAAAKQLEVKKGEGTTASTITVIATKASILTQQGRPADFSALKVDDKIEVTGVLNSKGAIEAIVIIIGGTPPPPPRPVVVTGTISTINLTGKTFEINVESLIGVNTLVPVRKMTIKWDDKTIFSDDLRGRITGDKLLVGQRLVANLVSFADPSQATNVLVLNPHVTGLVADAKGLPGSFVVNAYQDPRILAPARLITIKLTATTKIRSVTGAELKPSDITIGTQVDAVGTLSGTEMTAEYVVVIGAEIKGVTSDVNTTARTFVVTDGQGAKTKVSVSERTMILLNVGPTALPFGPTRPDEFIKLIANKPYTVVVFGLKDASGSLQAVTIRGEEKK